MAAAAILGGRGETAFAGSIPRRFRTSANRVMN